jgi:hypothetical protein
MQPKAVFEIYPENINPILLDDPVIVATSIVVSLHALRVRLDTIIPGTVIHWVWDCLVLMTNSQAGLIILPFELIFFFYGLWLLRNYIPPNYQIRYKLKKITLCIFEWITYIWLQMWMYHAQKKLKKLDNF